jgi:deoxyribonuclease V
MQLRDLHRWDVGPSEAISIQRGLRDQLSLEDDPSLDRVGLVAGVDNAYRREGDRTIAVAAVVVLTFPALEPVETQLAEEPVTFPYVPGLLSFREAPAILAALRQVERVPDLFLFDAQGRAHPRRLGAAAHLGLFVDRPSIGCAKSRLIGRFEEPGPDAGAWSELTDRGETIGAVVRTRARVAPLFVSPGHRVSFATAVRLVLACCRGSSRLPVPAQLAHNLATARAHPEKGRPRPSGRSERVSASAERRPGAPSRPRGGAGGSPSAA